MIDENENSKKVKVVFDGKILIYVLIIIYSMSHDSIVFMS